ncbi:MAG TPA: sigma-70 family RNA polymerase sigma factor [Candidatus Omnitrophota bacterium]|nr:sigma-70 family RNA polymerase sigma factor [Candidatus Omnitrophota bacterium]HPT06657.1 sigma-70 family RNA polymerase sigma factor [Candidatus Omnitrophota bacterium]
MNEDLQFIEQFLTGDDKGFEALVRKYQDRALNIVYSVVGNDRDSQDIVQEAFLKVYNNLQTFRKKSQFTTWIYRIVVNTAYDFLRKRKNIIIDGAILERTASSAFGPYDALSRKERDAMLQQALGNVPVVYRVALVLKDIENLRYEEIAQILQCSIGTVESKIYRARQILKGELVKLSGEAIWTGV